jgi:hypothetical protein
MEILILEVAAEEQLKPREQVTWMVLGAVQV